MKRVTEMRLTLIGMPVLFETTSACVAPHLGIDFEYESVAETAARDAAPEPVPDWDHYRRNRLNIPEDGVRVKDCGTCRARTSKPHRARRRPTSTSVVLVASTRQPGKKTPFRLVRMMGRLRVGGRAIDPLVEHMRQIVTALSE